MKKIEMELQSEKRAILNIPVPEDAVEIVISNGKVTNISIRDTRSLFICLSAKHILWMLEHSSDILTKIKEARKLTTE